MKKLLFYLCVLISGNVYSQNFEIYVSDAGNFNNPPWQILKFDSAGQSPSVFVSSNLNWPQDILFLGDSVVLISNLGSGKITMHRSSDGTYLSDFAIGISGPTRMKIGRDSLLYVLQWLGNGLVKRYHLDGTSAGNFTTVAVPQSIGLDWDAAGNLYVSSYNGKYVRKFDSSGADMGLFVDSNLQGPTNIWFDGSGELLINDYNGSAVKKFDSTGAYVGVFIPGIGQCEGVNFLPNGNILIGSGTAHSIKEYDSNGNYLSDFIASGAGNLLTPNAINIRPISPVSVEETNKELNNFIHPSSGSEFYFSDVIQKARSISLYSLEGKLIKSLPKQKIWKPMEINKGYYLIRIIMNDGSQGSMKIYITN